MQSKYDRAVTTAFTPHRYSPVGASGQLWNLALALVSWALDNKPLLDHHPIAVRPLKFLVLYSVYR